ncbi:MAG: DUF1254 domain-containing protein [Sphingomonas sp.]
MNADFLAPQAGVRVLHAAARAAFLYALPMTEIAIVRGNLLGAGVPAGQFFVLKGLATPKERFVTTPNADTIYASAFIDLSNGPATLIMPPLGDRYGSVALMDMFSDNFTVLGTRTTGQGGGTFTLVGPDDAAPAGAIRSATPWVWALARVVVAGPDDVSAAKAILADFRCETAPAGRWAPGADRSGPWDAWLKAANALMLENPAPVTDRRILDRMAPLGLGDPMFDPARFTAAEVEDIVSGIADATILAKSAGFNGRRVGNWIYPAANTGNFFQDYLGRARIAVAGLAALPIAEATYLAGLSPDGGLFAGEGPWRLTFPAGSLPPVDAFWSLTMYEAQANGAFFLTDNPIDRYTIGDRTPGLVDNADGSLDIWISRTDPGQDRRSNWLPAPATAPFLVMMRAYLPHQEIITQTYMPPSIERI